MSRRGRPAKRYPAVLRHVEDRLNAVRILQHAADAVHQAANNSDDDTSYEEYAEMLLRQAARLLLFPSRTGTRTSARGMYRLITSLQLHVGRRRPVEV